MLNCKCKQLWHVVNKLNVRVFSFKYQVTQLHNFCCQVATTRKNNIAINYATSPSAMTFETPNERKWHPMCAFSKYEPVLMYIDDYKIIFPSRLNK